MRVKERNIAYYWIYVVITFTRRQTETEKEE